MRGSAVRYHHSRRVHRGFLTVLYLLDQSVITVNPNSTTTAPGPTGDLMTYAAARPLLLR
jgi:hypothetical protein